ncbi:PROTEIN putative-RELATED [Salix koriyanagi]|uniref:PROTEIN putative-RELATED n=1 Tax=Salix koriyanagi TaxID=2511006 RepID=A0A9Q0TFE0_9ROSI|nr:PROTEIN putative-RELATED [Salix koriyanagi]
MGRFVSRERELEVDLESGGTTIDEDRTSDPISANGQAKTLLKEAWTGPVGFQGSVNISNSGEVGAEDVELLIDKNSEEKEGRQKASVDRKDAEEKHMQKSLRKPPKPPRPPRSLSLDASDKKLMKEITELAMRNRARILQRRNMFDCLRRIKSEGIEIGGQMIASFYFLVSFFLYCVDW